MAEPGTPVAPRRTYAILGGLGLTTLLLGIVNFDAIENEWHTWFADSTEDDVVGTTVLIKEEEKVGMGKWPTFDRLLNGSTTFTVTIEGQQETFSVRTEDADRYKQDEEIPVTYDRHHWKDGTTTITDVRVKH